MNMKQGTSEDDIDRHEAVMKLRFIRGRKQRRTRWLPCGYIVIITTLAFAYILKSIQDEFKQTPDSTRNHIFKRDEIDNFTASGLASVPTNFLSNSTIIGKTTSDFTSTTSNITKSETIFPTNATSAAVVLIPIDNQLPNCSPPAIDQFPHGAFTREQRQHGGIILHLLVALYMFTGLAVVCDDYFVSSLESISERLHLQSDVAGATFMAAGSSAPELFTSVIGVFITHTDVGIGTIVGSAVFNLLCIVSLCGLLAGMVINLTWWPLIRDSVFYLISIFVLILVMMDGIVQWFEALWLLILYVIYIIAMYFNPVLSDLAIAKVKLWMHKYHKVSLEEKSPLMDANKESFTNSEKKAEEIEMEDPNVNNFRTPYHSDRKHIDEKLSVSKDTPNGSVNTTSENSECQQLLNGVAIPIESKDSNDKPSNEMEDSPELESPLNVPDNPCKRLLWVIGLPIHISLYVSIPDCKKERWKNWYLMTFFMSTFWIAVFSYIMVWMVTVIGDALSIPDAVMGLTLLAAGTSVPDAMASILVARDGYGDMAISNTIGSNIFDILLCLGLPWFLRTISTGESIYIYGRGLTYTALMLFVTVFTLLVSISLNRWKLDKKLGVIFLILYALFMVFALMYELNVFGEFNVPTCPSVHS
ncbi:sodium/potassium/calcium exchanger 5-like [Glandiceps talaboti]